MADLASWRKNASTKGNWADGFSAMELARLWLAGVGPSAITELLAAVLPGFTITRAVAEARVAFDRYPGGVRNHDVLAWGQADLGPVVVGIEGKVNESLDATISGKYKAAATRKAMGQKTNLARRVNELLEAFAGRQLVEEPALGGLRYQLFSGIAGTLAAATSETKAAAFIVHLIQTPSTKPGKLDAVRAAVDEFSALAFGQSAGGPLVGPVFPHASTPLIPAHVPLWIGVIETPALPGAATGSTSGGAPLTEARPSN